MLDQSAFDALRSHLVPDQGDVINGARRRSQDGAVTQATSPIDGQVLAHIAKGEAAGVDPRPGARSPDDRGHPRGRDPRQHLNGADNTMPMGGIKQSGNGHDMSLHALEKYVELKTAWIQL